MNRLELLEQCREALDSYPEDHPEREKIEEQIKELERKERAA